MESYFHGGLLHRSCSEFPKSRGGSRILLNKQLIIKLVGGSTIDAGLVFYGPLGAKGR